MLPPPATTTRTSGKPHYEVLDGLRGTAAVAVVLFHFSEYIYRSYSVNPLGHGFLAVDFFFCLSGFVVGYAYDDRRQTLGIGAFLKARLIRLHPLVILGTFLGLLVFLSDARERSHGAFNIVGVLLAGACLLPVAVLPGGGALFPLNSPSWSLFWEYVANLGYALGLWRVRRSVLVVLLVVSAFGLGHVAYVSGSLWGGYSHRSFWDGAARVSYSFLGGLLVYRSGWIIRNPLGYVGTSILLLATLMFPYGRWWNAAAETVVVIFGFPLIVACGAGTSSTGLVGGVCRFFGRVSYPLYMTHNAAITLFARYHRQHRPSGIELGLIVWLATILLLVVAAAALRLYDEPVRAFLRRKLLSRRTPHPPSPPEAFSARS